MLDAHGLRRFRVKAQQGEDRRGDLGAVHDGGVGPVVGDAGAGHDEGDIAVGCGVAGRGSCYFSCSRAVVRKMVPTRWVNSAWVVTSVVNQSRWLPPASFFSASTTDSSAAW